MSSPYVFPLWLAVTLSLVFSLLTALALNRMLLRAVRSRPQEFVSRPTAPPAWISTPDAVTPFPAPQVGKALTIANFLLLGATGVLMAFSPLGNSPFDLSQVLLMLLLFYPLALLDLLTQMIETPLIVAGLVLRLTALSLFQPEALMESVTGMLVGAGGFYLVGMVYETLRGRQGLGEGDPALVALIGAFVGWRNLAAVVLVSAALGLLVGYTLLRIRGASLNTPIPFGPFLCLGGGVVYLATRLGLPGL
ncbi:MAG: A24 family peptidase [Deltaproteobacteria bacterium]|nr:A24 family peptidase [Deltaproteobacteria bacterium]